MAALNSLPPPCTVFLGLVSHVLGSASPDLHSIRTALRNHYSHANNASSLRAIQKLHATVFRHLYTSGAIHLLATFKTHCVPLQWQKEREKKVWDSVEDALEHSIDAEQRAHRLRQRTKRRPKNGFLATPARIVRYRYVYRPKQCHVQEATTGSNSTDSLPTPLSSFDTPSPSPKRRTLLVVLRTPRLREWIPAAESALLTSSSLTPDPSEEMGVPAAPTLQDATTKAMARLVKKSNKAKAKPAKVQHPLAKVNKSKVQKRKAPTMASPCWTMDHEATVLRAAALGLRRRRE